MGAMPATQKSNENDNTLQHFVTDLLSGLLEQLAFRARTMRKLVSAIFMLNNSTSPGIDPPAVQLY